MKKTLSLILALVLILSYSSILAEDEPKYDVNLTKSFLVLTEADFDKIIDINSENNPANKIISYSFTGAFPVVDNKLDTSLADPTDEEIETYNWIGTKEFARNKIFLEKSKDYFFPRMELGNTIDIKLSTKEKANLKIELYDINGLVQEISEDNSNAISLSYTPTVAGMYKAKYMVDDFIVGIDDATVESSEKKSVFYYFPGYYPLLTDLGFSWFLPREEIGQEFNYEKISIYNLKHFYYICKKLLEEPDFARELLYTGFSFSEKLNARLAVSAEASDVYGQLGTVERSENYYNYLLDGAEQGVNNLKEIVETE